MKIIATKKSVGKARDWLKYLIDSVRNTEKRAKSKVSALEKSEFLHSLELRFIFVRTLLFLFR